MSKDAERLRDMACNNHDEITVDGETDSDFLHRMADLLAALHNRGATNETM